MTDSARDISVIIPCWNVEPWLGRCLDSVLAALPKDAEALVVDDGSTDGTHGILVSRAASDPRLRVIASGHCGVSAARNAALSVARGRLVFFVDADDRVEPDFFTAMAAAIERDGADCCVCAFSGSPLKGDYRFRTNAEVRAGYLPRVFGYSFDDVRAWYAGRPLFAGREMAGVWRFAFRREFLERERIRFDETIELYEDAMFLSECMVRAKSMTCVDRPLYLVTDRESGAMRSVPRDGARLCRNKLRLLARRRALDATCGGTLGPLYAASCVFSALEILACTAKGMLPRKEGFGYLREYLADPFVRESLAAFPLSWRRPVVAAAVLALRRMAAGRGKIGSNTRCTETRR